MKLNNHPQSEYAIRQAIQSGKITNKDIEVLRNCQAAQEALLNQQYQRNAQSKEQFRAVATSHTRFNMLNLKPASPLGKGFDLHAKGIIEAKTQVYYQQGAPESTATLEKENAPKTDAIRGPRK